ncbi:MAG: hypothetical protein GX456_13795 [Verrucomicrobia bacterium]|nr:hypothetical protein [Verrucomicrobiota bacterium]
MKRSEPDSAAATDEPASAVRSRCHDPSGRIFLCLRAGFSDLQPTADKSVNGRENGRAPARAGKNNGAGSAAVPGRIQPDDRSYDPLRLCKCCARLFTGWRRPRMAALLHAVEKATALGSAAVPGRINATTDLTTRFDYANPARDYSPAGGGQEWPRSCKASEKPNGSQERGRPRPHQRDGRPCTCFNHSNPSSDL